MQVIKDSEKDLFTWIKVVPNRGKGRICEAYQYGSAFWIHSCFIALGDAACDIRKSEEKLDR